MAAKAQFPTTASSEKYLKFKAANRKLSIWPRKLGIHYLSPEIMAESIEIPTAIFRDRRKCLQATNIQLYSPSNKTI